MTDEQAQKLIDEAMPADGEFIEFEGQNCYDWNDEGECRGWDGKSRRCDCGNRRVDWVVEDGEARGVAY